MILISVTKKCNDFVTKKCNDFKRMFTFSLQENIPELAETFIVNITGVQLKSEASRMNSSTASPRVASPGNELATVTIRENDESRGILNVDATLVGS